MSDDTEYEGCGYTYDHDYETVYEDPTYVQYECRECGAETWEDR